MKAILQYIGDTFVGRTYHFKCDCLLRMDFVGTVVDHEMNQHELTLLVQTENKKIVKLGINHPNLTIEEV